jgi:hypothetical protein
VRRHAASRPANNELHLSPQPVITDLLQELLLAALDAGKTWLVAGFQMDCVRGGEWFCCGLFHGTANV